MPGPGAHLPLNLEAPGGPAFTMGQKLRGARRSDAPAAPGDYHVEQEPGGPAFTMAARAKAPRIDRYAPGPGEHLPDAPTPSAPAWTMAPRVAAPPELPTPAPGTYEALHAPQAFPGHSLGPLFDGPPRPRRVKDVLRQVTARAPRYLEALPGKSATQMLKQWNESRTAAAAARTAAATASFEFVLPRGAEAGGRAAVVAEQ